MIIREEARKRDKEEARRITARQEAHRRVGLDREIKKGGGAEGEGGCGVKESTRVEIQEGGGEAQD